MDPDSDPDADSDPAIFVLDLQDVNKREGINVFFTIFCLIIGDPDPYL
jgi:hypothetical protein